MNHKLLQRIKNSKYKKSTLIFILILILVITMVITASSFMTIDEDTTEDRVSITQYSDNVTISITEGEEPYNIQVKDPNGNNIHTLSQPGTSISINKFSTDTIYGEYKIIDADSNIIKQFIIDEPTGERTVTVTVTDQENNTIKNANVTIGETTRKTSSEGTAKFYNVTNGYQIFTAESEGYQKYRTNFEITQKDMNISVILKEN